MNAIVIRQDKAGINERWMLDIGDAFVTLAARDGRILLRWSAEDVSRGVQFPSFSKSIKYTGFNVAGWGVCKFSMDAVILKQLRAFANRGIVASGPAAVKAVLRTATLTCAGGLALFICGVVCLCITVSEVTTGTSATNGNPHPVGFVTMMVGFAIMCRGVYGFYQYSQLKKLS